MLSTSHLLMGSGAVGPPLPGGPPRVLQTVGRAFTLSGAAEGYLKSQVNKLLRTEMLIVPRVSTLSSEEADQAEQEVPAFHKVKDIQ